MTQEEIEKRVTVLLAEIILEENAEGEICECGELILDREKTAAVIETVLTAVADYMIQFAVASDSSARLHIVTKVSSTAHLH